MRGFFIAPNMKKLTIITALITIIALSPAASRQLMADDANSTGLEPLISQTSVGQLTPKPDSAELVVELTAYSSTRDQTDSTPFTTASGEHVRAGIVAANFLPFGTKIKIPELFGDRIFTVEDRMSPRFNTRVDIWFPNRHSAIKFGIQKAKIIALL